MEAVAAAHLKCGAEIARHPWLSPTWFLLGLKSELTEFLRNQPFQARVGSERSTQSWGGHPEAPLQPCPARPARWLRPWGSCIDSFQAVAFRRISELKAVIVAVVLAHLHVQRDTHTLVRAHTFPHTRV